MAVIVKVTIQVLVGVLLCMSARAEGEKVESLCKSVMSGFSIQPESGGIYLSLNIVNGTSRPIGLKKAGIHFGAMQFKAVRLDTGGSIGFTPVMAGVPPGGIVVNPGENYVSRYNLFWLFPTLSEDLKKSDVAISFTYALEPLDANVGLTECVERLKLDASAIIERAPDRE